MTKTATRPKGPGVDEAHRDLITAALVESEGRSRTRTLTADDVLTVAVNAEKRLERAGVPKRLRDGAVASYNPWTVPKSYRSAAIGTTVTLQRTSARWVLVAVAQGYAHVTPYGQPVGLPLRVDLPGSVDPADLLQVLLAGAGLSYSPSTATDETAH